MIQLMSLPFGMISHVGFKAQIVLYVMGHNIETGNITRHRAILLCNSRLPNKKRMVMSTNRHQVRVVICPAN